jgi:outer membrane protein assembly factor BamD
MKKKTFLKWAIILVMTFSLLSSCGGKGKAVKTVEGDPEALYKQGLARFNKRDYSDALKKFEELKSSFPDSPPYTLWAELKIGDCHFLKGDYVEAIAAYEDFKKIHPTHEEILYVQYQIGMAYFNQMRTLDRDQTPTKNALSNFEYLIGNYPPSLFTEKTKAKIDVCKKRLADHEFYIGDFYYKHGKFQAAALRFEGLLEKFPNGHEEDKTLYLLGKSYLELDRWEKAREAFTKIVNEYPKSSHYKEAKSILDKGMTEKKVSLRKTKEAKKKGEAIEEEQESIVLVKFEEEGKRPISLKEERIVLKEAEGRIAPLPVTRESVKPISPRQEVKMVSPPLAHEQMQEDRARPIPPAQGAKRIETFLPEDQMREERTQAITPSPKMEKIIPPMVGEPLQEERIQPIPPSPLPKAPPRIEIKPDEEKRIAALPSITPPPKEKEKPKKEVLPETEQAKLVGTGQPMDITSDRVETYSKENLIIFKGNVMARQKDIVIYADSLEAVVIEDGKGIEKVIADGNVKIQQGVRVANCEKAIFYNLDQKVVLTGDPKVWEGDNIVSGDEIVFDIEQNRIEVKGGPRGRGKAKIQPGGAFEKQK